MSLCQLGTGGVFDVVGASDSFLVEDVADALRGWARSAMDQPAPAPLYSGPQVRPAVTQGAQCQGCGRVYSQRSSLYRHRKYECGKEPQFQCPYCPHRAKLRGNLDTHIRGTHGTARPP
ncbi:zinc finger protein 32-like [Frankliniella occidentalis]|uniref:Zinc finger protein 32-like n=1 Tax=Frankliniella occidentalis TaxID=133901 RepID=A0A6J1TFE6_FRAOC|nr:zinc finger protein 32-like [Frankliniella occidentalis]